MSRPLAMLTTLLLLAGCGEPGPPPLPEAQVRDSAGVRIVEYPAAALEVEAPTLRLAARPTVRIGVLDGAPEYQFSRPGGAVRLSDGSIVVLERNPAEFRVYAADGSFLRRVSRQGEGPGELTNPSAFTVTAGDTLVVWDSRFRRVSRFTPDGAFVDGVSHPELGGVENPSRIALASGGARLVFGSAASFEDRANQGPLRENWAVIPVSPEGVPSAAVAVLPGQELDLRMTSQGGNIISMEVLGRWFWGAAEVAASPSGAWYVDRARYEAVHVDPSQGVELRVRVEAPRRPLTRAVIEALESDELDRASDQQRPFLLEDLRLREYPDSLPALEAVFGDEEGRVWMGITPVPRSVLASGGLVAVPEWLVFEQDGTLLGRVTLPPRSRPMWADRSGVLLLRNDDLDVGTIEWYPFEPE